MDDFAFREELVSDYERFFQSFTPIRAEDIRQAVNEVYTGTAFALYRSSSCTPTTHRVDTSMILCRRHAQRGMYEGFQVKQINETLGKRLRLCKQQADVIESRMAWSKLRVAPEKDC